MGQPAARVGDMHVCPMQTPAVVPIPHVGGPILPPCAVTVLTGGIPQARITDMCVCVGPPDVISKASTTVYVCGLNAARMGDMTVHGGSIVVGLPTVLIGDMMPGGGGGGGGGAGMPQSGFTGGNAPLMDFTNATAQAATLKKAAQDGAAFCQTCF